MLLTADENMDETRKHPDLFTAEEAAAYLHLESVNSLRTMRDQFGLIGHPAGKGFVYWREDLDNTALRIVGRSPMAAKPSQKLRMAR